MMWRKLKKLWMKRVFLCLGDIRWICSSRALDAAKAFSRFSYGVHDNSLDEVSFIGGKRMSKGSTAFYCFKLDLSVGSCQVLNWRRKQLDYAAPMTVEEYSKGIAVAGRLKNVDLAMEPECTPSIITYNILISAFGRLMLVDHMEATLREIKELSLTPTIHTYKGLIAGYITAWMWEEMEKTYRIMKAGPIKPDIDIHLLMLRGYAHSGKLEKMEEIYEMVRDHVDHKETPLIRAMICAYCRSSHVARVEKVEKLLRLIPEDEYRPWLNVLLICLYATEDLLEQMENSINEAFEHKAYVTTVGVMKCIISSYFRHNAVDKLADFVRRAEHAGWKVCRSLYHCKMVMYAAQMRISEMERVLDEMDRVNMHLSKKTFWILYHAYERWGPQSKLEQVIGMMCKHGYKVPLDACNS
ncbi:Pentatricopeptide repeat-containing protein [Sesamum angolense]|uniref:Pentatricopeptide repeat-containing protein n=1 Tax=Sesamum angolense TaxID=2727404 RepID=A0AAE1X9X4_9LAMI|nr:Pentatricopeptide repeat-containing protein [Sesamum angolense]